MPDSTGGQARFETTDWVLIAALVLVALLLHLHAGFTLPRPWPDESHFITPALTLVRDARLAVPELNAPEGIFWMPTGYYVVQLPLLLLRVDPLAAARWLSWAGTVLFALVVARAAVRGGAHRAVAYGAAGAWLCMARVVAMANIARMEGVVLGLAAVCVELLSRDRWPAAVAVAVVAPLVHPVGVIVVVAVVAAGLVRRPQRRVTRGEWLLLAAAGAAWAAELTYFALNANVAAAHLRFQFTRKAGRAITATWWQWLLLAASGVGGLAATLRWRNGSPASAALWVLLALAGGFVLVDVAGREMWYEALGRETTLLLLALVAFAVADRRLHDETARHTVLVIASLAMALVAVFALRATLVDGWYGMRAPGGSRGEWHAFTASTVSELQRLDAAGDQAQVVVVDPLSGFGQEIFARRWSRLRFVQPTPATPLDASSADYVLVSPGAPFVTDSLVKQWGSPPPVQEFRSGNGTFTVQLLANPR